MRGGSLKTMTGSWRQQPRSCDAKRPVAFIVTMSPQLLYGMCLTQHYYMLTYGDQHFYITSCSGHHRFLVWTISICEASEVQREQILQPPPGLGVSDPVPAPTEAVSRRLWIVLETCGVDDLPCLHILYIYIYISTTVFLC